MVDNKINFMYFCICCTNVLQQQYALQTMLNLCLVNRSYAMHRSIITLLMHYALKCDYSTNTVQITHNLNGPRVSHAWSEPHTRGFLR